MGKDEIFLKVTGARGPINGESTHPKFTDQIMVIEFNWGMDGNLDAHAGARRRTSLRPFEIIKFADTATTGLMGALHNNEDIKEAVLTVCKAGKESLPFMIYTLEKGRVVGFGVENRIVDSAPVTVERIRFAFQKVRANYTKQSGRGAGSGTSEVQIDVSPN